MGFERPAEDKTPGSKGWASTAQNALKQIKQQPRLVHSDWMVNSAEADMIKEQLLADVKTAMKARDKRKVGALRLITAEIKRREVDDRKDADDAIVMSILEKMLKQRRDAFEQYQKAGRDELADQESFEMSLISEYLPEPLSAEEVGVIVNDVINELGADHISKMGQVMGALKERLAGRADMGMVGGLVKGKLSG
jgi:uncharacterized protein YqeY